MQVANKPRRTEATPEAALIVPIRLSLNGREQLSCSPVPLVMDIALKWLATIAWDCRVYLTQLILSNPEMVLG